MRPLTACTVVQGLGCRHNTAAGVVLCLSTVKGQSELFSCCTAQNMTECRAAQPSGRLAVFHRRRRAPHGLPAVLCAREPGGAAPRRAAAREEGAGGRRRGARAAHPPLHGVRALQDDDRGRRGVLRAQSLGFWVLLLWVCCGLGSAAFLDLLQNPHNRNTTVRMLYARAAKLAGLQLQ